MKKPSNMLQSARSLAELAMNYPDMESYGPETNYPYLAFDLATADLGLESWLSSRPCPIIGVGRGDLDSACDIVLQDEKDLPSIHENISAAPLAAMTLVQHLRASETLDLSNTLIAESFAYGTIQMGPEFQHWVSTANPSHLPGSKEPILELEREGHNLHLTFNQPETRNAIGVTMRDALCEALELALMDPTIQVVTLRGNGRTFSTGGAVEEFGIVSDPATAHWIRTLRLPATRLAKLAPKLKVHVNGAAIGAGAEIAAFGNYVSAASNAWFQLPELRYGLIPGAGGTASIPKRIGRQKTAYMALTMKKIRAEQALDWGLIDKIID